MTGDAKAVTGGFAGRVVEDSGTSNDASPRGGS